MRIAAAIAAFAATLTVPASADFTRSWPESPTNLKCDIGPTERIIAEDVWLLYACDDEASLVFVAPNGDPAPPSYFALLLDLNGRYRILRQGITDRAASQAAYRELKSWSANDIVAARREATAASANKETRSP